LATFILRLGTEVEWEEEQSCFEGLARELAEFYSLQYNEDQVEEGEDEEVPKVQQQTTQSKPMKIDEDETMDEEEAPTSTTTTTTATSTTSTSTSTSKESLAHVKNKRYWTVEHIFSLHFVADFNHQNLLERMVQLYELLLWISCTKFLKDVR